MNRGTLSVILTLLVAVTLIGCGSDSPVYHSNQSLCQLHEANFSALNSCHRGASCRLTDREYFRWKKAGILATKYCALANYDRQNDAQELLKEYLQKTPAVPVEPEQEQPLEAPNPTEKDEQSAST